MPQLNKARHKANRYRQPCVKCGSPEHPTWQHGKDQEEIFQQLESRRNNPEDPWTTKKVITQEHVADVLMRMK